MLAQNAGNVEAIQGLVGVLRDQQRWQEAETLARILDLAITEFGHTTIETSAAFEVLLRRLHAIVLADKQGHWELACLLEEVPSAKSPDLHQVILKDLVTQSALIDQAEHRKAGSAATAGQDDG